MNFDKELRNLKKEVEEEYLNNIEPYWYLNSQDTLNGGFFGRVGFDNTAIVDSEKGGILNARILWSFSAAHKRFGTSHAAEMAHRAYNYLNDFFFDEKHGGIYWTVDSSGEISDDRKHVYVQAFAIYGLTEYYSAFGNEAALDQARELYKVIESHCKDEEHGGYFEAYSRDWELIDDVRLSDKDKNEPKSMNTHLHILEGYTNLYRYTADKEIRCKIEELLEIFYHHIFNKNRDSLICFLDEDWSPRSKRISLGHDIEASWLCYEAAEVIEDPEWITRFEEVSYLVSKNVTRSTDLDGGIINEFTKTTILDSDKDWWPQAEAMVGHINAYQVSGNADCLKAAFRSWDFIKSNIIDRKNGEWFEKVNRKGTPFSKLDKIRLWKAPYHNTRAILEISARCENLLGSGSETIIPVSIEKPFM